MKIKHCITFSQHSIITVSVPVMFFRFPKQKTVFAECPALEIITEGKNLTEAKKMFEEALYLWVEGMNECGDIPGALKELGWKISKTEYTPPFSIKTSAPVQVLGITQSSLAFPSLTA